MLLSWACRQSRKNGRGMDPAASIFKMIYRDQPVSTEGLPWRKEDFTKRKRPPTEAASRDPAHRQRAHCTMDRSGWMARECRATDRNLSPLVRVVPVRPPTEAALLHPPTKRVCVTGNTKPIPVTARKVQKYRMRYMPNQPGRAAMVQEVGELSAHLVV